MSHLQSPFVRDVMIIKWALCMRMFTSLMSWNHNWNSYCLPPTESGTTPIIKWIFGFEHQVIWPYMQGIIHAKIYIKYSWLAWLEEKL